MDLAAKENEVIASAKRARSEYLAHTPLCDHAARNGRRLAHVAGCAGGDITKEHLFCRKAPEHHGDIFQIFLAGAGEPVFYRHLERVSHGFAAGDDGYFLYRVGVGEQVGHKRVTGFVRGRNFAFAFVHHMASAFRTKQYFFNGIKQCIHGDLVKIAACSENSRLIHKICQVCAREARRAFGQSADFDVCGERLAFGVNGENSFAVINIRRVQHHAAIKPSRTEQSGIQHIRTVGGGHDDHAGVWFKPIHFHEDLVEGLLPFIVRTAESAAALSAHGVNFINKHNAGRSLFALRKQVAHAAGPNTHKHFHKSRTAHVVKRHVCFASHGTGEQRLSCSRAAHEQYAFGNFGAEFDEFLWIFQKVHHFIQRHLVRSALRDLSRRGLSKRHGAVILALHLPQKEPHDPKQEQEGEEIWQNSTSPVRGSRTFLHVCLYRTRLVRIHAIVCKEFRKRHGRLFGHRGFATIFERDL